MVTISGVVIAKNAEKIIGQCLKSLSFCTEIIVVDAHSQDTTALIAKKMGAKVIEESSNDFAKQRNIGLKSAKSEWILYIDTDERVTPSLREEIVKYTNNPINKCVAFRIKRKNFYYGNRPWPYIEKIVRLFKKDKLKEWVGSLHESPLVEGELGDLDGFLHHFSHQNISEMVDKTNIWSETEAKLRLNTHHPKMVPWRFIRVMMSAFYDSYVKQGGYKAGTIGLIESMYQSFSIFITYAKLWEQQAKK